MPELPEVETVVRHIKPQLVGKTIVRASLPKTYKRALATHSLATFNRKVKGSHIRDVTRRAKFIVLHLDDSYITIHLRMTGRIMFGSLPASDKKYTTFSLQFSDQSSMHFKDVRKFGRIELIKSLSELDERVGIEPLSDLFTLETFTQLVRSKSRILKSFLLDQKQVAGLGNIYVDEALWQAKIHPLTKTSEVSTQKLKALHRAIPEILNRSIALNGTTFQSFYYGEETSGEFVNELFVFGRTDQPCKRCACKIVKLRVSQRGTHICPKCQKL